MQHYYWFIFLVAMNGILLLFLTINVSRLRIKFQISWGDGGHRALSRAIRTHANATEQVPIYALIILALCILHTSELLLALLVVIFTFARILHAYGMLAQEATMRKVGAAFTYFLQCIAVIALLVNFFLPYWL